MKRWHRADEWTAYAHCGDDPRFTADTLSRQDLAAVIGICSSCPVRRECAQWAMDCKATGVVAAGIHIPDPGYETDPHANKAARRFAYSALRKCLKEQRGQHETEI